MKNKNISNIINNFFYITFLKIFFTSYMIYPIKNENNFRILQNSENAHSSNSSLNNIIWIGDKYFRHINFASFSNKDMIIETSSNPACAKRMFFAIQKNGRKFFIKNGNESNYYSLEVDNQTENEGNGRFDAENFIITMNEGEYKGKEYLMSIAKDDGYAELYDFDNDVIYQTPSENIIGRKRNNIRGEPINYISYSINYIIYYYTNNSNYYIYKVDFPSINLTNANKVRKVYEPNAGKKISCFRTTSSYKATLCFCIMHDISDDTYLGYIHIYNEELAYIVGASFEDANVDDSVFIKSILFKNNIGIFAYYHYPIDENNTKWNFQAPKIIFKNVVCYSSIFCQLDAYLSDYPDGFTLDQRHFNMDISLNDLIKLSEKKIAFISTSEDREILYIVLISVQSTLKKITIRYYDIEIYNLYQYKIFKELRGHSYKDFLSFGFSFCRNKACKEENSTYYSGFMIFSYANGTDTTLNVIEHLLQYNDEKIYKINIDLKKYIYIENNIFGYRFLKITIKNIIDCDDIIFYTDSGDNVTDGYDLSLYENIIVSFNNFNINKECKLLYFPIIREPTYEDDPNYYATKIGDDKDYYESQVGEYEGKHIYYNIELKKNLSTTCQSDNCELCLEEDKDYCITCKNEYKFIKDEDIDIIEMKKCYDTEIELEEELQENEEEINEDFEEYEEEKKEKEKEEENEENKAIEEEQKEEEEKEEKEEEEEKEKEREIKDDIYEEDEEDYQNNEENSENEINIEEELGNKNEFDKIEENENIKENEEELNYETDENKLSEINENSDERICTNPEILSNNCSNGNISLSQLEECIEEFKKDYINKNYKGDNKTIQTLNALLQLAKLDEQKENSNPNISSIDLGECENILKKKYDIDDEDSLIILKLDIKNNDLISTNVQYEIYNPYNLEKLEMDCCEKEKIIINAPVNLTEETISLYNSLNKSGYNLFNATDNFYNDICTTYTSESGTDVSIIDRQNELYSVFGNITLCQSNCEFTSYDINNKKAICNCATQIKAIEFDASDINSNIIRSSFLYTFKYSNLLIIKCYKVIFNFKPFFKNIGRIIMSLNILLYFSIFAFYLIKDRKNIVKFIEIILQNKFKRNTNDKKFSSIKRKKESAKSMNRFSHKKKTNNKTYNTEKQRISKIKTNKTISKFVPPKRGKHSENASKRNKFNQQSSINTKIPINDISNNNLKGFNINIIPISNIVNYKKVKKIKKYYSHQSDRGNNKKLSSKIWNKSKKRKIKNEELLKKQDNLYYSNLNDEELNTLNYEDALIYDKRNYSQYYISLLKKKQLIIFAFVPTNDYNLMSIKILLFLLSFTLYLTVNAFFFTDRTMHSMFSCKGKYNFIVQMPKLIFSTLVSAFTNILLRTLALTQKNILKIKQEKIFDNALKLSKKINDKIRFKLITFFFLSIFFLLFFWYFISCFCGIYLNTQKILLNDTFISFGLSMIYPFGLALLPGIFRIISLRAKNKDKKCCYKICEILDLII